VGCMESDRKRPRGSRHTTAKQAAREVRADRAFVLQLDERAQPPRHVTGRVEHVTSGQVAHITSLRELLAFLAKVLRNHRAGGREITNTTLVGENGHSGLAANAPASRDQATAPAPAQSILRGREEKTSIRRVS